MAPYVNIVGDLWWLMWRLVWLVPPYFFSPHVVVGDLYFAPLNSGVKKYIFLVSEFRRGKLCQLSTQPGQKTIIKSIPNHYTKPTPNHYQSNTKSLYQVNTKSLCQVNTKNQYQIAIPSQHQITISSQYQITIPSQHQITTPNHY